MTADLIAIATAFILGFTSRLIGLPPLVGYLIAGFILYAQGFEATPTLMEFSEIGVTLLLFTVGLKLKVKKLASSEIWAVSVLHMSVIIIFIMMTIFLLGKLGIPLLENLPLQHIALISFALSFSSTVFAVKVLDEKGELSASYGQISIGILVMQDIAAVIFLAISTGKLPTAWAFLLLLLIPLRPFFYRMLDRSGHGELMVLLGLILAVGGATVFEMVGIKGDLGALIIGVFLAQHPRASELSKHLLGFKDLFLVGFFLMIGLSGPVTVDTTIIALLLLLVIPIKVILFFWLLIKSKLRARTSFLGSLSLANYSEFGLIVAALAMSNGWLSSDWLIIIAIALSISFIIAAPFNADSHNLYSRFRKWLQPFEREELLSYEQPICPKNVRVIIFGMGRVGSGAYDAIEKKYESTLLGVDFDADKVEMHKERGRNVVRGSVTDPDFWERLKIDHESVALIMLAVSSFQENLYAVEHLRSDGYDGKLTAIARYPDEEDALLAAGADSVFNLYAKAGAGFAEDCSLALETKQ